MSKILQTPIINQIIPFDPTEEHIIEFTYDDNQSIRNRAVVSESISGTIIYDNTQDTMRLQHIIPANTLLSGKQYLIQIQVFDIDNNSSNLSDATLFYCFTNPTFDFGEEIIDGVIYRNANIQLLLNYYQPDGEGLRSFQFFQYSFDKTLIESSSVFYLQDHRKYTFYRLDNNTTYYFRAIGETTHGMILDTGYVEVNIAYFIVPSNMLLEVKNIYNDGYIQLHSNIIIIGYELENDNWELKDGELHLWDNSLTYNSGFSVDGDFILMIEARRLPLGTFLTTNNNEFSLSIVRFLNTYYCKLTIKDNDICYYSELPTSYLLSDDNSLVVTNNDELMITDWKSYAFEDFNDRIVFEVKRVNGIYSLDTYYKSDRLK